MALGDDVVAIPGTRYAERMDENVGAMAISFSEAEVRQVSEAIPIGAAVGMRYSPGVMTRVLIQWA